MKSPISKEVAYLRKLAKYSCIPDKHIGRPLVKFNTVFRSPCFICGIDREINLHGAMYRHLGFNALECRGTGLPPLVYNLTCICGKKIVVRPVTGLLIDNHKCNSSGKYVSRIDYWSGTVLEFQ